MEKIKVGVVQMHSKEGDIEYNLQRALNFSKKCVEQGADIIALPELFAHEYFPMKIDQKYFKYAQPVGGSIIRSFQKFASKHKKYMLVPWFEVDKPNVYFNSAALIDPSGNLVGVHRKTHIPALKSREKLYFRPGDKLEIFSTNIGNIGILICYERSFPELARILTIKGADIIFIPSSTWRERMWREELRTRALENGVFIVAINKTGKEENGELCGLSMVISPSGEIIFEVGKEEGAFVEEIDLNQLEKERINYPIFRDRRIDLYKDIIKSSLND